MWIVWIDSGKQMLCRRVGTRYLVVVFWRWAVRSGTNEEKFSVLPPAQIPGRPLPRAGTWSRRGAFAATSSGARQTTAGEYLRRLPRHGRGRYPVESCRIFQIPREKVERTDRQKKLRQRQRTSSLQPSSTAEQSRTEQSRAEQGSRM